MLRDVEQKGKSAPVDGGKSAAVAAAMRGRGFLRRKKESLYARRICIREESA